MLTDLISLQELLKRNRSVRRFDETRKIDRSILCELVSLVRFTASGRNAQPLRYHIVNGDENCNAIFPLLAWAGYFKNWDGPEPGERPVAYLVQCLDTRIGGSNCLCDDGLQLEAITLGATICGLSGCIIKAFNPNAVSLALGLPEYLIPRYVLALGFPKEQVVIEDMDGSDSADFKYYRTPDGVHHVPKRPLEELIVS